jgi:hypothetical protein
MTFVQNYEFRIFFSDHFCVQTFYTFSREVRVRTSIVMSGLLEPPVGREVGELPARPLGFYTVSLAERHYSIALRYTKTKLIRSRRF